MHLASDEPQQSHDEHDDLSGVRPKDRGERRRVWSRGARWSGETPLGYRGRSGCWFIEVGPYLTGS
jgi:hypothetical protein